MELFFLSCIAECSEQDSVAYLHMFLAEICSHQSLVANKTFHCVSKQEQFGTRLF